MVLLVTWATMRNLYRSKLVELMAEAVMNVYPLYRAVQKLWLIRTTNLFWL
jgi:hypothetical protein